MIDKTFALQIGAAVPPLAVDCTEGDTAWRWHFQLYLGGARWTIPTGGAATFVGLKNDGNVFDITAAISGNEVVVTANEQVTAYPGPVHCVVRVLDSYGKIVASCPVVLHCRPNPQSMGTLSGTVLSAYDDAIARLGDAIGVQKNVTDWMNEHITQPTDPVVDSSLTVSGAAADAKVAGDYISDIQSALMISGDFADAGEYTVKESDLESGYWGYHWKASDTKRLRNAKLIRVHKGTKFVYTNPTLKIYIGVLESKTSESYLQTSGWVNAGGENATYTINYDGYATLMFEAESDITVNDYDCNVTIHSAIQPGLLVPYTPAESTWSVWDMPDNTYTTALPAAFESSLSADFTLNAGWMYKVFRLNRLVFLFALGQAFFAIGNRNDATGEFLWQTSDMLSPEDPEVQVYTSFDMLPGRWDGRALGDSTALRHTAPVAVTPGRAYYLAANYYYSTVTLGCFLDKNKTPLRALTLSDISQYAYDYTTDNPSADTSKYVKLYTFTVPANCYYLSLNAPVSDSDMWRIYLASKPLFRLGGTGNLIISKDSSMLQKQEKRLCVIGPSYAMIDRRAQDAMNGQHIVGFQEYLWPYYKDVTTFGYSGGAWGQYNDSQYISIYSGIVTGYGESILPKDFTPYDEVLLIGCNPNGYPGLEPGTAGTWDENTSAVTTFAGGLRGVVEYILQQKPTMKIYLSNFWHTKSDGNQAYRNWSATLNEEMLKLANLFGLQYIDLYNGTPFNKYNYSSANLLYTYDGIHPNHEGMRQIADVLVREMVG